MSLVFKAPARLEAEEIKKIRPEFERLAASGRDVVFDLARTEAIDGSGVGALVFTFKRLAANGNHMTIRNISGQPLALLNAADLLRTLSSAPSIGMFQEALQWLGFAKPARRAPILPAIAASSADPVAANDAGVPEKGAA